MGEVSSAPWSLAAAKATTGVFGPHNEVADTRINGEGGDPDDASAQFRSAGRAAAGIAATTLGGGGA